MKRKIVMCLLMAMMVTSLPACGSKDGADNAAVTEQAAEQNAADAPTTEQTAGQNAADASASEQTATDGNAAGADATAGAGTTGTVDIVNDYNNTDELKAKFPVVNETPVADGIGKAIENRLLTGFENWNRGFDAWKAWGDILYTEDSIYNVHGARLTLAEYQQSMDIMLKQMGMLMGDFNNMVICDDWAAIHYDITTIKGDTKKPGTVMEFVQFKDYGDELGTRVVEGWGGPKDDSYEGMTKFQSDEEKEIQKKQNEEILAYQIPDTDDLVKKYPVKNPTTDNSENADAMREAILKDFDAFNKGVDEYATWAEGLFTDDAKISVKGVEYDKAGYVDYEKEAAKDKKVTKLYFDNMLISGDWVAIHYRTLEEDPATGEKDNGDRMEFFRFTDDGKVDLCYKK